MMRQLLRFSVLLPVIGAIFSQHTMCRAESLKAGQEMIKSVAGLTPEVNCLKEGDDWDVFIQFEPVKSYERYTWLIPANPYNAQLQVCLTNGTQCQPTNPKVMEAASMPFFTTVSNALKDAEWSKRGMHWPWKDSSFQSSSFKLKTAFSIPFTNDVILQVVPLMYKENTNDQKAWLVYFPPSRFKLKSSGTVEKLE